MKKMLLLTIMLSSLLNIIAADYRYKPMVRENVVWQYVYTEPFDYYSDMVYVFFQGDTIIGDYVYEKCYLLKNHSALRDTDEPIMAVREDQRVVYAISWSYYGWNCPKNAIGEYILYDFNKPNSVDYRENALLFTKADDEPKLFRLGDGYLHKGYPYYYESTNYNPYVYIKREVGAICEVFGATKTPLCFEGNGNWNEYTNDLYDNVNFIGLVIDPFGYYGMDNTTDFQLINLNYNGTILYERPIPSDLHFRPDDSGLATLKEDSKEGSDTRYYNMEGVAYDTKPTEPGIYIHQGRKVVVK